MQLNMQIVVGLQRDSKQVKELAALMSWSFKLLTQAEHLDGEPSIQSKPLNLYGRQVFLFFRYDPKRAKDIETLMLLIGRIKTQQPLEVTLLIPYLPYSRDKAAAEAFVAALKAIGVDSLIAIELHQNIKGVKNLSSARAFASLLANQQLVVGPDAGAQARGLELATVLSSDLLILAKQRQGKSVIHRRPITKPLPDSVVLFDDIASSGQTINSALKVLNEQGVKKVTVCVAHLVSQAMITPSNISIQLITTDSFDSEYSKISCAAIITDYLEVLNSASFSSTNEVSSVTNRSFEKR